MEMQQIRYFLAVCDKGSFTRAAQSTYVAQPSLTQAIKKLEEELGGELFLRERSGCRLTSLGYLVEPTLRRILHEVQHVKAEAVRFSRSNTVPLRIGVLSTVAARHLSPCFAEFQQERPHVELELVADCEAGLLQQFEREGLDVAVSAPTAPLPGYLESWKLYEERYAVVFDARHRFNALQEIDLAALQPEPYLDRLDCEIRETLRGVCLERQIDLFAAYRSNSDEWVLGMVRAGAGVTLMPEFSIPRQADGLGFRYLVSPEIRRTVYAIFRPSALANPETAMLLQMLRLGFK